jgi:hypothetical protein
VSKLEITREKNVFGAKVRSDKVYIYFLTFFGCLPRLQIYSEDQLSLLYKFKPHLLKVKSNFVAQNFKPETNFPLILDHLPPLETKNLKNLPWGFSVF